MLLGEDLGDCEGHDREMGDGGILAGGIIGEGNIGGRDLDEGQICVRGNVEGNVGEGNVWVREKFV